MHPTRCLREAQHRVPLIHFLGKRVAPKTTPPATPADKPTPHPASPSGSLPDSFMSYRSRVQQHGPLASHMNQSSSVPLSKSSASPNSHAYGAIGGLSGHGFGHLQPGKGEVWDRSELPSRFRRLAWTKEEIEAIELGGAGLEVGWGSS